MRSVEQSRNGASHVSLLRNPKRPCSIILPDFANACGQDLGRQSLNIRVQTRSFICGTKAPLRMQDSHVNPLTSRVETLPPNEINVSSRLPKGPSWGSVKRANNSDPRPAESSKRTMLSNTDRDSRTASAQNPGRIGMILLVGFGAWPPQTSRKFLEEVSFEVKCFFWRGIVDASK